MQHDDWKAALSFARSLPGIDANKIVAWGTSFGGGHVLTVAGRGEALAAVIAQVPHVSGPAAVRATGFAVLAEDRPLRHPRSDQRVLGAGPRVRATRGSSRRSRDHDDTGRIARAGAAHQSTPTLHLMPTAKTSLPGSASRSVSTHPSGSSRRSPVPHSFRSQGTTPSLPAPSPKGRRDESHTQPSASTTAATSTRTSSPRSPSIIADQLAFLRETRPSAVAAHENRSRTRGMCARRVIPSPCAIPDLLRPTHHITRRGCSPTDRSGPAPPCARPTPCPRWS